MIFPVLMQPAAVCASVAPVTTVYEFGTVSLLDMPYADHDFVYTNTGTTPEIIVRLQASCHCTSALIASSSNPDGEVIPYTLAPSASIKIHASINLGMDPSGPVSRTVSVYLKDQDDPAAIYTLSGAVEPDAIFTPQVLDFGAVKAGQAKTMVVLVSLDSRLIPNGFPRIVADKPGITVTSVPNPYHGPLIFQATRAGHEVDHRFEVTVPSNMSLGKLNAGILLVGGPAALPMAQAQFEINTGLIAGRVVGNLKSNPETVAFGTILTGHSATQKVTLIGNTPADLKGLKVVSDSSFITATLDPEAGSGVHRTLTLTVKKTAPAGLFNSKVSVLLVNGQRLVIPLVGYITIPIE